MRDKGRLPVRQPCQPQLLSLRLPQFAAVGCKVEIGRASVMPWPEQARRARWPILTDAEYLAKWKANCDSLPNGCWHWKGWKAIGKFMYDRERGYPDANYRGKKRRLTRIIAGWGVGRELTKDEVACHKCDYPPCINPEHLWVGTVSDNTQDRIKKGRDHHSSLTPRTRRLVLHLLPARSSPPGHPCGSR